MKTFLATLLLLCGLPACKPTSENPEKVARYFLESYYKNDLEKASKYADNDTREELKETLRVLQAEGVTPAEMKTQAIPVIIDIEGIIANDGSLAVCAYRLRNSEQDANGLTETLMLTYTEDGWKASF